MHITRMLQANNSIKMRRSVVHKIFSMIKVNMYLQTVHTYILTLNASAKKMHLKISIAEAVCSKLLPNITD